MTNYTPNTLSAFGQGLLHQPAANQPIVTAPAVAAQGARTNFWMDTVMGGPGDTAPSTPVANNLPINSERRRRSVRNAGVSADTRRVSSSSTSRSGSGAARAIFRSSALEVPSTRAEDGFDQFPKPLRVLQSYERDPLPIRTPLPSAPTKPRARQRAIPTCPPLETRGALKRKREERARLSPAEIIGEGKLGFTPATIKRNRRNADPPAWMAINRNLIPSRPGHYVAPENDMTSPMNMNRVVRRQEFRSPTPSYGFDPPGPSRPTATRAATVVAPLPTPVLSGLDILLFAAAAAAAAASHDTYLAEKLRRASHQVSSPPLDSPAPDRAPIQSLTMAVPLASKRQRLSRVPRAATSSPLERAPLSPPSSIEAMAAATMPAPTPPESSASASMSDSFAPSVDSASASTASPGTASTARAASNRWAGPPLAELIVQLLGAAPNNQLSLGQIGVGVEEHRVRSGNTGVAAKNQSIRAGLNRARKAGLIEHVREEGKRCGDWKLVGRSSDVAQGRPVAKGKGVGRVGRKRQGMGKVEEDEDDEMDEDEM